MTEFQTPLGPAYSSDVTRAAAIARIREEPDPEYLLAALGLNESEPPAIIDGQPSCPACRKPYRRDGRTSCRQTACELGPRARSIAKPATAEDKEIAEAYAAGATILELARKRSRSQAWVRESILRAGGEMRRAVPRPAPIRPRPSWGQS